MRKERIFALIVICVMIFSLLPVQSMASIPAVKDGYIWAVDPTAERYYYKCSQKAYHPDGTLVTSNFTEYIAIQYTLSSQWGYDYIEAYERVYDANTRNFTASTYGYANAIRYHNYGEWSFNIERDSDTRTTRVGFWYPMFCPVNNAQGVFDSSVLHTGLTYYPYQSGNIYYSEFSSYTLLPNGANYYGIVNVNGYNNFLYVNLTYDSYGQLTEAYAKIHNYMPDGYLWGEYIIEQHVERITYDECDRLNTHSYIPIDDIGYNYSVNGVEQSLYRYQVDASLAQNRRNANARIYGIPYEMDGNLSIRIRNLRDYSEEIGNYNDSEIATKSFPNFPMQINFGYNRSISQIRDAYLPYFTAYDQSEIGDDWINFTDSLSNDFLYLRLNISGWIDFLWNQTGGNNETWERFDAYVEPIDFFYKIVGFNNEVLNDYEYYVGKPSTSYIGIRMAYGYKRSLYDATQERFNWGGLVLSVYTVNNSFDIIPDPSHTLIYDLVIPTDNKVCISSSMTGNGILSPTQFTLPFSETGFINYSYWGNQFVFGSASGYPYSNTFTKYTNTTHSMNVSSNDGMFYCNMTFDDGGILENASMNILHRYNLGYPIYLYSQNITRATKEEMQDFYHSYARSESGVSYYDIYALNSIYETTMRFNYTLQRGYYNRIFNAYSMEFSAFRAVYTSISNSITWNSDFSAISCGNTYYDGCIVKTLPWGMIYPLFGSVQILAEYFQYYYNQIYGSYYDIIETSERFFSLQNSTNDHYANITIDIDGTLYEACINDPNLFFIPNARIVRIDIDDESEIYTNKEFVINPMTDDFTLVYSINVGTNSPFYGKYELRDASQINYKSIFYPNGTGLFQYATLYNVLGAKYTAWDDTLRKWMPPSADQSPINGMDTYISAYKRNQSMPFLNFGSQSASMNRSYSLIPLWYNASDLESAFESISAYLNYFGLDSIESNVGDRRISAVNTANASQYFDLEIDDDGFVTLLNFTLPCGDFSDSILYRRIQPSQVPNFVPPSAYIRATQPVSSSLRMDIMVLANNAYGSYEVKWIDYGEGNGIETGYRYNIHTYQNNGTYLIQALIKDENGFFAYTNLTISAIAYPEVPEPYIPETQFSTLISVIIIVGILGLALSALGFLVITKLNASPIGETIVTMRGDIEFDRIESMEKCGDPTKYWDGDICKDL